MKTQEKGNVISFSDSIDDVFKRRFAAAAKGQQWSPETTEAMFAVYMNACREDMVNPHDPAQLQMWIEAMGEVSGIMDSFRQKFAIFMAARMATNEPLLDIVLFDALCVSLNLIPKRHARSSVHAEIGVLVRFAVQNMMDADRISRHKRKKIEADLRTQARELLTLDPTGLAPTALTLDVACERFLAFMDLARMPIEEEVMQLFQLRWHLSTGAYSVSDSMKDAMRQKVKAKSDDLKGRIAAMTVMIVTTM